MVNYQETFAGLPLVNAVVEGIREKKGVNVSILDMTPIENSITSYFVICEGSNNVQVEAISSSIEEITRQRIGEKPIHVEGRANAQWILLDYLDVVVHVFQKPVRNYYSLETLWADAPRTDLPDFDSELNKKLLT